MGRRRLLVFPYLLLFGTLLASPSLATPSEFMGLGDLPGAYFYSQSYGISADAFTVVGESASAAGSGPEAFRWTKASGMVGVGDLPGGNFDSQANGVSADGSTIVGEGSSPASGTSWEAFRWTSGGGMVGLGDLPGGLFESHAYGVSGDGSIVVGFGTGAAGREAFRWTSGGGMVSLGDLVGGSFYSEASAVSADGSTIVGYGNSASGTEAFRWANGTGMVGLGVLPGPLTPDSRANAVSADGSVIVGSSRGQAFRWTSAGGMIGLGDLPGGGLDSRAWAASADGSIIVGMGYGASGYAAFIWDPVNGLRDLRSVLVKELGLDLSGWVLTSATGVSADGATIAGFGTNPSGSGEAWLAVLGEPVPEPATAALLALAAAVFAALRAPCAATRRGDRGALRALLGGEPLRVARGARASGSKERSKCVPAAPLEGERRYGQ